MTRIRRVVGIDFGIKRIGLAIGNTLTRTAQPLAHVSCLGTGPDWNQLDQIIDEWKPELVVVGLPISMSGEETDMSRLARAFAEELEQRCGRPVEFMDERLTSSEADNIIRSNTPEGKKIDKGGSGKRDSIAAQLIVQSYLEDNCAHD